MYEEIFNQIRSAANKRNLKDSTIHAYCTSVAHFLNHTAKDIDALTTDDVDIFLTEKKLSGISPETYNHYHSGIRFFYKKVLKMNWDDDDIPRMKRDRKLPAVLTKAEISAILDATPNLKHKAMIATMYSGGLRVSEVTHLHYAAMHILLPQTENIIRNLAKMCGDPITYLKEDGTEEFKPLSQLLNAENLRESYDENVLFTLETLLDERGGPNLRNENAHGILSPAKGSSGAALCFLSLLIRFLSLYSCESAEVLHKLLQR